MHSLSRLISATNKVYPVTSLTQFPAGNHVDPLLPRESATGLSSIVSSPPWTETKRLEREVEMHIYVHWLGGWNADLVANPSPPGFPRPSDTRGPIRSLGTREDGWKDGERHGAVPERDRGVAAISRFPTIDTSRAIGPPDIRADWGTTATFPRDSTLRAIKAGSLFRGSMKFLFFFPWTKYAKSGSFFPLPVSVEMGWFLE